MSEITSQPKPWFKKKRFIIPTAIVLLFGIAGALGGSKPTTLSKVATISASTSTSDNTETKKLEIEKKRASEKINKDQEKIAQESRQVEELKILEAKPVGERLYGMYEKYRNYGSNKFTIEFTDKSRTPDLAKMIPPLEVYAISDTTMDCNDAKLYTYNIFKDTYSDEFIKKNISGIKVGIPNTLTAGLGANQVKKDFVWSGQTNFWKVISQFADEPSFDQDKSDMVYGKGIKSCK